MRGRRFELRLRLGHRRLIPAGAGQTQQVAGLPLNTRAHPRRCGADERSASNCANARGSSPQVRGRRRSCLQVRLGEGLIPAGAGQTARSRKWSRHPRAHPRRCGADRERVSGLMICMGSSPQVRGRPRSARSGRGGGGLIPAGAGQTHFRPGRRRRNRAHPRRCGADRANVRRGRHHRGSSPQVRGRLIQRPHHLQRRGLIPAGAGQTRGRVFTPRIVGAHPRRCGADMRSRALRQPARGSSPQVRGRPEPRGDGPVAPGLIPAGAGQTRWVITSPPWWRAHPRRCGADAACSPRRLVDGGSSPQVRGRLMGMVRGQLTTRLIPAGAGQTGSCRFRSVPVGAHPRRCGAD